MKVKPNQAAPTSQPQHKDSPVSKQGSRLWLLLPILIAGCIAIWFQMRASSQPQRILDKSMDLIIEDQLVEAREQLTKLREVPEYASQCRVLDGILLVREGQYDQATELLERLPDDQRVRPLGLTHRGIANFHLGNFEEAIDDLETSQAIIRDDRLTVEWLQKARAELHPDHQLEQGLALVENVKLQPALLVLRRLEQNPNAQEHASLLRGMLQLSNNQIDAALESFSISGRSPALREMSLLGTAQGLTRLGDSSAALNAYLTIVRENNHCAEAHHWLASWYYSQRASDDLAAGLAERHLKRLSELTPQDPRPIHSLAKLYVEDNRLELAGVQYEKVWNMKLPTELRNEIAIESAVALLGQNRNELAWELLQTESLDQIQSEEKGVLRDTLKAICLINQGELEKALDLLDAILIRDSDNLDALVRKGEVMTTLGMLDEAASMYEKAVELAPSETVVLEQLAQLYRRIDGMENKAVATEARVERIKKLLMRMNELREIASAESANLEARIELGKITYQLGKADLAKSWFEAVLQIDPGHEEAKENLALLAKGQPVGSDLLEPAGKNQ